MHMANLFPPGRVLWALREGDLDPAQRLPSTQAKGMDKLRLFEVQDVERVFGQIVFAKDMLRCVFPRICCNVSQSFRAFARSHMPHQYDRVLHELL